MRNKKIKNAKINFPETWMEMNPKDAHNANNIIICVEGSRVAIYYAKSSVENLTLEESIRINTYTEIFGFSEKYRIYGLIEQSIIDSTSITNVGNAQLIRD